MRLVIKKSLLSGKIDIPPSKSHTMRALLLGAMATGTSRISNYLESPDTHAMVNALRHFGVSIIVHDREILIAGSQCESKLTPAENIIDAGNSGIVLRFVGALSALLPTYTVITGDNSIRHNRPVQPMLSALNQLGGFAVSANNNGKAPILIRGPLKPGFAKLSGEDSQPVSAMLIAASFLSGTTHLEVSEPGEKPWIDMTLHWLKKLGAQIEHQDYKHYKITGPLSYYGFDISIPGDFSSAAFPLAAAFITQSKLTLENLDFSDIQGDKKLMEILQKMGADLKIIGNQVIVDGRRLLKGITIDANDMIDAIPILAVLGCYAAGKTEIFNAKVARAKESDRIHAMAVELHKMGANIQERQDGLVIHHSSLRPAKVSSHVDHRIAMALSIAALGIEGESEVEDIECIAKSYPTFVADFQGLGAKFREYKP